MNDNPNLNFVLTMQEANIVLAALQELPAKVANPITQKLTEQAKPQLAELVEVELQAASTEAALEV